MPTAFCVCYGGGHVKMIAPVLLKLIELGWDVKVLGLTTAYSYLYSLGIKALGFKDFIDPIKDQYALEIGKILAKGVIHSSVSLEESIAYLGISYAELEKQVGKEEAKKSYEKSGRQAFFPISFMQRICSQLVPDVIVSTNSPRSEKAVVYAAKKLGIPAVVLIDLFLLKNHLLWFSDKNFGDRICVISDYTRDELIRCGRDKEQIIVTGNPSFDILVKGEKKASLFSHLKSKKKILWAPTPEPAYFPAYGVYSDPNLNIKIENNLINIVHNHPDWHLIIRRHPNETKQDCIVSPQVSICNPKDDLKDVLLSSDLVLTTYSTVAIEAHILQKIVLCLEFSPYNALLPLPSYGIAYGVSEWTKVEEKISQILKNLTPLPISIPHVGQATELIVNIIQDLEHNKKSST